ncbi:MAG TPA: hypothetical protein VM582_10485, partial [Candidatus Thermoplasmatota archaeon]|nr:hypothetical protein [Candidatus Thermoplasmatota archaeon]
ARVEMVVPADDEEFAGALMTMDMRYDDEVSFAVPEELKRALGLRYGSDRPSFFRGFGGGGGDAPETWTFQVAGGLALAEIHAEVHAHDADEGEPLWSMPLAAGSRAQGGLTLTFHDADGDGKVSPGDTLTIERGEDAGDASVSLKDTVTGLRVTPGAGGLLAGLAAVAAALASRRR